MDYEVKACRGIEFSNHHGSYWLHMQFDNVTAAFDVIGLHTVFNEFRDAGIATPQDLTGKLFEARWKSVEGSIHAGEGYCGEQIEAIRIHPAYCKRAEVPNWIRCGITLSEKEMRETIREHLVREPQEETLG